MMRANSPPTRHFYNPTWLLWVLLVSGGCPGVTTTGGQGTSQTSSAAPRAVLLEIARLETARESADGRLASLSQDTNPEIRVATVRALGRIQNPEGLPTVLSLLRDPNFAVRREAIFATGQISDPRSELALIELWSTVGDVGLQGDILTALGKIGGTSSLKLLEQALVHDDASIREAAAVAVGVQGYRRRWEALPVEIQARLILALADPNPSVTWAAAYGLFRSPLAEAQKTTIRDAVVAHLGKVTPETRCLLLRTLGKVGTRADVATAAAQLQAPEWRVRVNALRALAALGGPVAATSIQPALQDARPLVQEQAIDSLGALGEPRAVPWITPFLTNPSPGLATAAIRALGKIQDGDALKILTQVANSDNFVLRSEAASVLGTLKDRRATSVLLDLATRESDPRVMANLAEALGNRREPESTTSTLIELLNRGDAAVVSISAEALADAQAVAAVPFLVEAWRRQTAGRDFEAEIAIIRALQTIGGPAPLIRDVLEKALLDPDIRVVNASVEAHRVLFNETVQPPPRTVRSPVNEDKFFGYRNIREAVLETEKGMIRVELYPDQAPLTVANFVKLARSGFFSGLLWHRVVPDFVVQTGSPRSDGWGGPGYTIPCEVDPVPYIRGTLGMALSGKDTGGSQFFITHGREPHLDGTYTVFGRVLDGQDVVDNLVRGDKILNVRFPADDKPPAATP